MLKTFNKTHYQDFILIILLIIASILLNKPVGDGFWRFDDPTILKCAVEYSWWEHFIIPESYQCLSAAHLTPWVTFSYALDYNLFGLEPKLFYYHQILSLSLVSVFSFILLRLYVNSYIAFLGILLFLIGSPVWVSSQQLMVRHYIEGLLFSIISIYFFILSLRFQKYRYALLGCLFYILATTAKEIYVPLLGILLFIPEGKLKDRLYVALPYFIWGVIYIVWRKYMLDVFIGSYQPVNKLLEYFNENIIFSITKVPSFILTGEYGHYMLMLAYLIMLLLLVKYLLLNIIISLFLFAPLIPMFFLGHVDFRFLLLAWWLFCVLFVFSYSETLKKNIFILFSIVMVLFSWKIIEKRVEIKKSMKPIFIEFDKQGNFFWKENNEKFLFSPTLTQAYHYFFDLKKLKQMLFGLSSPQLGNLLNLPLFQESVLAKSSWQYNNICQCMEQISYDKINSIVSNLKNRMLEEKQLFVFIKGEGNLISWTFGPYQSGEYSIVSDQLVTKLHYEGQKISNISKLDFHICYESPEGWITYSPEFTLEKNQTIDWKRP